MSPKVEVVLVLTGMFGAMWLASWLGYLATGVK